MSCDHKQQPANSLITKQNQPIISQLQAHFEAKTRNQRYSSIIFKKQSQFKISNTQNTEPKDD